MSRIRINSSSSPSFPPRFNCWNFHLNVSVLVLFCTVHWNGRSTEPARYYVCSLTSLRSCWETWVNASRVRLCEGKIPWCASALAVHSAAWKSRTMHGKISFFLLLSCFLRFHQQRFLAANKNNKTKYFEKKEKLYFNIIRDKWASAARFSVLCDFYDAKLK